MFNHCDFTSPMFSYLLMDKLALVFLGVWNVLHHFLSLHGDDDSLALLKVDMKNAFNECSRHAFFDRVLDDDFPEI